MRRSDERLTIGFVADDTLDKPDGVQQYILTLGEWLRARGHDVHYLVGASRRQDVANVHSLSRNIKVRFNGNRLSMPLPARKPAIRRLLADQHFDVLHIQMPYSPLLAQRVIQAASRQVAVVGTFHILPLTRLAGGATRLLGAWLRSSLRRFDIVFAVSPAAKRFADRSFGLTDSRVLPNVVDVPRFATAKPFDRYRDGVPTIVFLGRLVPRKGCATLLRAVAELRRRDRHRSVRLVICGKGPLQAQLEALAKELGLADAVEFAGFIDEADKPRYLASADIAVFPSSGGESFGIVLLEAMATGRPVVLAGDNPGYRSVMEPRSELLFTPGDSVQLADKLQAMLANPQQRRQLTDWQRQYVAQFDVAAVGRQLEAAYRQALRVRRG